MDAPIIPDDVWQYPEKAKDLLRKVLAPTMMVHIMLRHDDRPISRYSVITAYEGQVWLLDDLIDAAGIFPKEQLASPRGLIVEVGSLGGAGYVAATLSEALFGDLSLACQFED